MHLGVRANRRPQHGAAIRIKSRGREDARPTDMSDVCICMLRVLTITMGAAPSPHVVFSIPFKHSTP